MISINSFYDREYDKSIKIREITVKNLETLEDEGLNLVDVEVSDDGKLILMVSIFFNLFIYLFFLNINKKLKNEFYESFGVVAIRSSSDESKIINIIFSSFLFKSLYHS